MDLISKLYSINVNYCSKPLKRKFKQKALNSIGLNATNIQPNKVSHFLQKIVILNSDLLNKEKNDEKKIVIIYH